METDYEFVIGIIDLLDAVPENKIMTDLLKHEAKYRFHEPTKTKLDKFDQSLDIIEEKKTAVSKLQREIVEIYNELNQMEED